MEDKSSVPYIVYEGEQARSERHTKRLTIALILCVALIFLSNAMWLYAWMQYDYTSEETTTTHTVDVNAEDGVANYVGNNGDITNGTCNSEEDHGDKAQNPEEVQ